MRSLGCLVSKRSFFSSFRSSGSFSLGSRLWQELLEVLEKIRRSVEEECDLRINVLDGFGFPLIRLQNFQELLIDFGPILEAILSKYCQ